MKTFTGLTGFFLLFIMYLTYETFIQSLWSFHLYNMDNMVYPAASPICAMKNRMKICSIPVSLENIIHYTFNQMFCKVLAKISTSQSRRVYFEVVMFKNRYERVISKKCPSALFVCIGSIRLQGAHIISQSASVRRCIIHLEFSAL